MPKGKFESYEIVLKAVKIEFPLKKREMTLKTKLTILIAASVMLLFSLSKERRRLP